MSLTLSFIGLVGAPPVIPGTGRNDQTNAELIYDYEAVIGGNYTTGGDPLDFTTAPPGIGNLPPCGPSHVDVRELGVLGVTLPGFKYEYVWSNISTAMSTPQGGGVQIFGTGAGNQAAFAEIANGAYTAPAVGTKLKIRAYFAKNP